MLEDNNLLADIWEQLKPALACRVESLNIILGESNLQVSMKKYFKTIRSCARAQLGVLINARSITLSIPENKYKDLISIMLTTLNSLHKMFALHDVDSLLGLASSLTLTTHWIKHTCIVLQHAVSLVLKLNSNTVLASGKNEHLTELLASKNASIKTFYLLKAYKIVWNSKYKFIITKSTWAEINLLISVETSSVSLR